MPIQKIICNELARPEGFEPPTTWFEARYSIQLSYGRAGGADSTAFLAKSVRQCPLRVRTPVADTSRSNQLRLSPVKNAGLSRVRAAGTARAIHIREDLPDRSKG
jgi:hypothetical protein